MQILANSDDPVGAGSCREPAAKPTPFGGTWQQQMKWAIRSVPELCRALDLPENDQFGATAESAFPLFAPLPYLSRIGRGDPDDPLLRQILPVNDENELVAGYSADPLGEAAATLKPGMLQKYRGRVLLVVTSACAIHCRYCFRRHFPYDNSSPSIKLIDRAMSQLAADESIREVILSGGDPLTVVDEALATIIERISTVRHIRRLRIHTRLPIVIPQRVTDRLQRIISGSRLKTVIVVHANHDREIDQPVATALASLQQTGAMLLNQAVLLKGVNDSVDALVNLSERLIDCGVLPYYLHQLDRVAGAAHFAVPVERGCELIRMMRANLPGYAVPRYVLEIAGQPNKTVLA